MSTGTIGDKTKEEACHGLVYFLRGKEGMQCAEKVTESNRSSSARHKHQSNLISVNDAVLKSLTNGAPSCVVN
jgi:hypothetical protein